MFFHVIVWIFSLNQINLSKYFDQIAQIPNARQHLWFINVQLLFFNLVANLPSSAVFLQTNFNATKS